jgi:glycosyltransferase involved in cell wall biosynthesis
VVVASVVIAAHNEAAVIGRCLEVLGGPGGPVDLDVTVVANGCTDDTVQQVARFPWVRSVELPEAGKAEALNAGDAVAHGFPRVYLDADIRIDAAGVHRLCEGLLLPSTGIQVAVPRRRLDLTGRPLLVRAYYTIQRRLPAFDDGLFGRGMIAVSEVGRRRFTRFPNVVADDLFLDSLFTAAERRQVEDVVSVVATPRRTGDLVRRLIRVRRGNADLRAAGAGGSARVRPPDRLSWLRDVVLPRPWLFPAAFGYVGITLFAAVAARRSTGSAPVWWRDESSRQER